MEVFEVRGDQGIVHLQQLWSTIWPRDEDMPIIFDLLALHLRKGYQLAEITMGIEELGKAGLWPPEMAEWPLETVLRDVRQGSKLADAAESVGRAYREHGSY
jgi:hypothetical protein